MLEHTIAKAGLSVRLSVCLFAHSWTTPTRFKMSKYF